MPTPTGPRAPPIGTAEPRDHRIEVDAATLTISGERPEPDEAEDASYLREERRCGPFSRPLALPARIDATKIDTRLEGGVLEVTLPLPPGSDTEPIQIRPSK
jgi:HSP20 family molecular chaperone IbpA